MAAQVINEIKQLKVSDLHKHPSNPRTLKDTAYNTLKQSIEANPELLEARPLILSNRTGKNIVIGGNQRLQVVKDLGWLNVPCVLFPDMSEEKEREIMIRDNVSNGEWDWDKLANEWDSAELNYWGLEVPDWEQEQEEYEGQTDQDAAPELEPEAVAQLGDLWLLGGHRLLCGDSTDKATVELLMNGQKAAAVVTDPPYGINANQQTLGAGKKEFYRGNDWDAKRPSIAWLIDFASQVIIWGGNYFSNELPITNDWLCWHKKNDGRSFSEFELAWTNLGKNCRLLSHHWSGEEKAHPTQKPLPVIEWCLAMTDGLTFDPFLGSGSTLIACEKTGRKCYGIELSPQYCDVIIKRWQDFTGKQATLEATGETFEEVKNGRAS